MNKNTKLLLGLLILFLILAVSTKAQSSAGGTANKIRSGTSLPATCSPSGSNVFYKSDTGVLYTCTSTNTWTGIVGGSGLTSLNAQTGSDQTFTNDTNVTIVSGADAHVITWSGTLVKNRQNAATVYNDASNTYSTGTQSFVGATALVVGGGNFQIRDAGNDHALIITPGTDLSANRVLTVTTGDAARTITLSGNPTLNDWFDQSVKQAASPTFVGLTLTSTITFPDNVRQTFNPGANAAGLNVGSHAGDPDTPSNGDLWYDSVANELTARINGANVALGAGGGGGSPAGSGSEIQYRVDASTFGAVTGSSVSGAAITLTGSPIVQVTDTDETTITTLLTLFHRNIAAVPQQGYGSGILLRGSDDENAADDMGKLSTVWSDPAGGSEDSDFTIQLRTAGAALAEKFRLNSLGSITIAGAPAIIASASNANISVTPNGTGEFRVVNGTTSQKLSVFNTYTSDSNYNKILIDAGSNYGAIMLTGAGGTAFNSSVFYISNGNSSGSLQFQTNNTNRWSMDANGHLLASTDNSFDIGASGATRPRNVYIATGLTVAGLAITNNIVQNSQSAAYTTVASDAGKHILHPTADDNARTFTIAAEASVNYAIGTTITFVNQINTLTIAINSDTLILAGVGSTGSRTLAANGIATVMKIASGVWIISGSGLT